MIKLIKASRIRIKATFNAGFATNKKHESSLCYLPSAEAVHCTGISSISY